MCEGRVLFHSHVHKSAEESAAQQEEVDERDRLKAERRRQQVRACRICTEHWHSCRSDVSCVAPYEDMERRTNLRRLLPAAGAGRWMGALKLWAICCPGGECSEEAGAQEEEAGSTGGR